MMETTSNILQPIIGYHRDDEGHWVAQLACGHNQHARHDPPLTHCQWVKNIAGRDSMLNFELGCQNCIEGSPADDRPVVFEIE